MTQDKRDWQKDMFALKTMKAERATLPMAYQHMTPAEIALEYWLQQVSIEKARADAAEAREQRLKEAIETSIPLIEAAGLNGRAISFKSLLSTIYPDIPKEGENE